MDHPTAAGTTSALVLQTIGVPSSQLHEVQKETPPQIRQRFRSSLRVEIETEFIQPTAILSPVVMCLREGILQNCPGMFLEGAVLRTCEFASSRFRRRPWSISSSPSTLQQLHIMPRGTCLRVVLDVSARDSPKLGPGHNVGHNRPLTSMYLRPDCEILWDTISMQLKESFFKHEISPSLFVIPKCYLYSWHCKVWLVYSHRVHSTPEGVPIHAEPLQFSSASDFAKAQLPERSSRRLPASLASQVEKKSKTLLGFWPVEGAQPSATESTVSGLYSPLVVRHYFSDVTGEDIECPVP